jgi:hypothetical protein
MTDVFQITDVFKESAMRTMLVSIALLLAPTLSAQTPRTDLPDPVKFVAKFDIVWKVVRSVLEDMDFSIQLEDRSGGKILTKPVEFITGSLTSTEVDKVAVKRDTVTGQWMKARYSAEVLVEIVSATETMVTVRTRMEGLSRDLDSTEKWVPLDSVGVFEKRILGKISLKLLGNEPQLDGKKGFWDKSPQPVPPRSQKPTSPPF